MAINVFSDQATRIIRREIRKAMLTHENRTRSLVPNNVGRRGGRPSLGVEFRNDSGETAPAHAVMRVTGATVDSATVAGGVITIGKPNDTFQRLYLVNGDTPVADDDSGTGTWLTDLSRNKRFKYVLYNTSSGTPAYGECWGPKSGQWSLEKNRPGFTIQGGNTGSGGTSRTVAIQFSVNMLLGKTGAAQTHSKNSSADIPVWMGAVGSETASEYEVAAYNRTADIDPEKWVSLAWINSAWHCAPLECND